MTNPRSNYQPHSHWMTEAIVEAEKAAALGEVPIGAVVVHNEQVIGRGHNLRETQHDPTLHAEMIAIREASQQLGAWRLLDCRLYVTLEPCPMCAGAILQSRLPLVVYGAADAKAGCVGSLLDLLSDERFNHRAEWIGGILEEQCGQLLKDFFLRLRKARLRLN